MEKKTGRKSKDELRREFHPIGKYRVRLLHRPGTPEADSILDIREYVASETFEGFTRRGIRLANRQEIDTLRDVLKEVLELNGFAKASPGMLPLQ